MREWATHSARKSATTKPVSHNHSLWRAFEVTSCIATEPIHSRFRASVPGIASWLYPTQSRKLHHSTAITNCTRSIYWCCSDLLHTEKGAAFWQTKAKHCWDMFVQSLRQSSCSQSNNWCSNFQTCDLNQRCWRMIMNHAIKLPSRMLLSEDTLHVIKPSEIKTVTPILLCFWNLLISRAELGALPFIGPGSLDTSSSVKTRRIGFSDFIHSFIYLFANFWDKVKPSSNNEVQSGFGLSAILLPLAPECKS